MDLDGAADPGSVDDGVPVVQGARGARAAPRRAASLGHTRGAAGSRGRRGSVASDGDHSMAGEGDGQAPRRGRATPPSRRTSTSGGNSEPGDEAGGGYRGCDDEHMGEGRAPSRGRMRCKRKRDCALTGVCDKFGGMQIHCPYDAAHQPREGSPLKPRRSKSILKKPHIGARVRFARQGRATKDIVMFDEANIKEVQTCLATLSEAGPDRGESKAPGTPRSVVFFQQAEESGGEGGGAPRGDPAACGEDASPTQGQRQRCGPPPRSAVWHDPDRMDSTGERSCGEGDQQAKRGPNFYKMRQRRVRLQEIEEGKSFKQILRQKFASDDPEEQRSPTSSEFRFAMGRPTAQAGGCRGFSPQTTKSASPRGSDFSSTSIEAFHKSPQSPQRRKPAEAVAAAVAPPAAARIDPVAAADRGPAVAGGGGGSLAAEAEGPPQQAGHVPAFCFAAPTLAQNFAFGPTSAFGTAKPTADPAGPAFVFAGGGGTASPLAAAPRRGSP
eukprot:TRINITY_DN70472_c0_g1_i1.p1 TRINITY_DN70472_c0_g1~~TRINITY_DN70472_c0_g1_i1.p1  ORF type:complete len:498 (+),score=130.34 TRINITY_DN70472_c0_g1_i1:74-1567(+)